MRRKVLVLAVMALAVGLFPTVALADAPAGGIVEEGVGVPGVALGDTRDAVNAAYGGPASCRDSQYPDGRQGLDASCEYRVDGGGRVTVKYLGPDGGPPQGSATDHVNSIGWGPAVSGWVTTAGINTTTARDNPEALLEAYPNAEVTYWYDGTFIAGVRDWQQGISISRFWDFYCGCAYASMLIFYPQDAPPEPEPVEFIYVAEIDMSGVKVKRDREIAAQVLVNDRQDSPAAGAVVAAHWTLPDGREQSVQATTAANGTVSFTLSGKFGRGTYYLFIDDVELADHLFIEARGLSHGSIYVK